MQYKLKDSTAGMSLLELVVAVLVLSIGVLAATRATDQSRLAIGGAQTRVLAQIVATNRAEELRLYANRIAEQRFNGTIESLPEKVTIGGQQFSLYTAQKVTAGGLVRTQITARSEAGTGVVFVTYLPTPQLGQP